MSDSFAEWCASLFGLTARPRGSAQLVFVCLGLGVAGLVFVELWGAFNAALILAFPIIFAAGAGQAVVQARSALWRAASLPLDDRRQPPLQTLELTPPPPTASTLRNLAVAVDTARRGRFDAANNALPRINRALLAVDEIRLLDAVHAMITLSLDDPQSAAQHALAAIPTGSEELDTVLGRAVLANAWRDPARLRGIHAAWEAAGVTLERAGTLGRLQRLTKLRIDARLLDEVGATEARALSSEARAIGDEDLAADLESRARETAYR